MIWQYLSNMYCYHPSQRIRGQVIGSKHKKNVSIGLIWMKQPMVSSPLNISTQLSQAKKKSEINCIYVFTIEKSKSCCLKTSEHAYFSTTYSSIKTTILFSHIKRLYRKHIWILFQIESALHFEFLVGFLYWRIMRLQI